MTRDRAADLVLEDVGHVHAELAGGAHEGEQVPVTALTDGRL